MAICMLVNDPQLHVSDWRNNRSSSRVYGPTYCRILEFSFVLLARFQLICRLHFEGHLLEWNIRHLWHWSFESVLNKHILSVYRRERNNGSDIFRNYGFANCSLTKPNIKVRLQKYSRTQKRTWIKIISLREVMF